MLEIQNCRATACSSGYQAIKLISNYEFDILMLDLLLPDMNGEEILKKIREINKKIPVIIISGQVEIEKSKLHSLDVYSYLQKPFELSQLGNLLKKFRAKKLN